MLTCSGFISIEAQTRTGDDNVFNISSCASGCNVDTDPAIEAEKLFWTHHCWFSQRGAEPREQWSLCSLTFRVIKWKKEAKFLFMPPF